MRYSSYAKKTYNSGLQRASVNDEHFSLLIEISPIRSEKTIVALREYLVYGYSKQESCDRNNVSNSYFCLCLKKLNYTHGIVSALKCFYQT